MQGFLCREPFEGSGGMALLQSKLRSQRQQSRLRRSRGQYPRQVSIVTIEHGSTPRTTVTGMSLRRRTVNQHRRPASSLPVAHVLFWAPLQDTCWTFFKDVEQEANASY